MKLVVVTATTGEGHLRNAIESVQMQSVPPALHLVVVDGREHESAVHASLDSLDTSKVETVIQVLERPTGKGGFYGHRIYAAASFLCPDAEIFAFLDADNTFDPDHVATLLKAMEDADADFAYALRRIVDIDGTLWCNDDCDSLGAWPRFDTYYLGSGLLDAANEAFLKDCPNLIDTSCYAIRRETLIKHVAHWNFGYGADCLFAQALLVHEKGVCTGRRTVSYRWDVDEGREVADYFVSGNELVSELTGGKFPWLAARPEQSYVTLPRPLSAAWQPSNEHSE